MTAVPEQAGEAREDVLSSARRLHNLRIAIEKEEQRLPQRGVGRWVLVREAVEQGGTESLGVLLGEGRQLLLQDEHVKRAVDDFMLGEMHDTDGRISWEKFSEWTRHHDFGDFVRKSLHR